MLTETIICGFGGQGVLFSGKLLANAALMEGKELSWLPSYGPEMRGGTCNCSVCISDDPIGSPLVTAPDIVIAMNGPSFDKFEPMVKPGGIVFEAGGQSAARFAFTFQNPLVAADILRFARDGA